MVTIPLLVPEWLISVDWDPTVANLWSYALESKPASQEDKSKCWLNVHAPRGWFWNWICCLSMLLPKIVITWRYDPFNQAIVINKRDPSGNSILRLFPLRNRCRQDELTSQHQGQAVQGEDPQNSLEKSTRVALNGHSTLLASSLPKFFHSFEAIWYVLLLFITLKWKLFLYIIYPFDLIHWCLPSY